jgi:hypothetical protein
MEFLFDKSLLSLAEVSTLLGTEQLELRPLELGDYDKGGLLLLLLLLSFLTLKKLISFLIGFLRCLEMLTVVGEVSRERFHRETSSLQKPGNNVARLQFFFCSFVLFYRNLCEDQDCGNELHCCDRRSWVEEGGRLRDSGPREQVHARLRKGILAFHATFSLHTHKQRTVLSHA